MDGRDPDFPEDVWVEGFVNAIAPANAARARLLLPMVQLEAKAERFGGTTLRW